MAATTGGNVFIAPRSSRMAPEGRILVVPWIRWLARFNQTPSCRLKSSTSSKVRPGRISAERPHLVAHDFGSLAALRGHLLEGLVDGRLTLIDAVAVLPSGSAFFRHARRFNQAMASLPAFVHQATFRAYADLATMDGLTEKAMRVYFEPFSGPAGQAAFYRHIAHASAEPLEEIQHLLGPLPFPVDVIWGEHDRHIPLAQGVHLADRLKADSFRTVPQAAHLVPEDAPEAVVGLIN